MTTTKKPARRPSVKKGDRADKAAHLTRLVKSRTGTETAGELHRWIAARVVESGQIPLRSLQRMMAEQDGSLGDANILRLVAAGAITGSDVEELAGRKRSNRPTAAKAAGDLYDALVREFASAPAAKLKDYGIPAGGSLEEREDFVRRRLGFEAVHVEKIERRNFRWTLEERVADVGRGRASDAIYATFPPSSSLALWGDSASIEEGTVGMLKRVPPKRGKRVPMRRGAP